MTSLQQQSERNLDKLQLAEAHPNGGRYELRMEGETSGTVDCYELFDGITLIFNTLPQGRAPWNDIEAQELQLDWCSEGLFELETMTGGTLVLEPGNLAVHDQRISKKTLIYHAPLFTGITLRIEYLRGAKSLQELPATAEIDFQALRERYTGESGCKIFSPDAAVRELLESIWQVDNRAKIERLRLKALELIVLLDATEQPNWQTHGYQQKKTTSALEPSLRMLSENLSERVTIEKAAKASGMSSSSFKDRFTKTYGMTPLTFRRQCRLQEAARLLSETDESIAQIAASVGYQNPSKFASAFATKYGITPSAWRSKETDF